MYTFEETVHNVVHPGHRLLAFPATENCHLHLLVCHECLRELDKVVFVLFLIAVMNDQSTGAFFDLDDWCVPCPLAEAKVCLLYEISSTHENLLQVEVLARLLVFRPVLDLAHFAAVCTGLATTALIRSWFVAGRTCCRRFRGHRGK